jgi:hypothetical protein
MKRGIALLLGTVIVITACGKTCTAADSVTPEESQVKAAMILNLAKFIEWPAEIFSPGNTPFMLCVIGKSSFGHALQTLTGKTVKGRRVVVRQISRSDEFDKCHTLVIGESELRRIPAILDRAAKHPVVTVSDLPGFTTAGGTIGLVEQEGKIRFEINLETAHHANIRISPQLIKLATTVRGGGR